MAKEKANENEAKPDYEGNASQAELAKSGYSLPDEFFETAEKAEAEMKQASGPAENKSATPKGK